MINLQLQTGTLRDYRALSEHHYRAKSPATATRVWVLRDSRPSVVGRFLQRKDETRTVGVSVESLVSLSCRMRDHAMHERYGTHLSIKVRARLLNDEVRCISRVVVHPQYRGLGLAVRLVRATLDNPMTPVTEALAAMGKVHPFFERAGMTAYPRQTYEDDARLIAALKRVGMASTDLALTDKARNYVDSLEKTTRQWFFHELSRWHARYYARSGRHCSDPSVHLLAAQQKLMFEPVYYLFTSCEQNDEK